MDKKLYPRFKELRLEKGLTQKELAEKLEVSVNRVRNIEAGKGIKRTHLVLYANFFNVSADYLIGMTDQRERW